MIKFENFTTHQLRVLAHLLSSKNVTATSHFFDTSQPAVSRLLAEMRQKFGDALLVRGGDGMVVTDRGKLVLAEVENILDRLSELVQPESSFAPEKSDQTFSLGFTDSNMVTLVPPLVVAIKRAGPNLRTHIRAIEPEFDVVNALASRTMDVVVDCVSEFTRGTYDTLRFMPLGMDDVVLLVREGHSIVDRPPRTAEEYLSLKHVAPYPISRADKGPIDGALVAQKIPRQTQCLIPEYNLIPQVLTGSNLVFTTCRQFAEHFSTTMPLEVVPAPDFFPPMEFRLLWHEATHRGPSAVWLRKQIQSAAKLSGLPESV
ncbi:LysR family transcriptional regulator [Cognatishimia activa]|uniref:HTH lysR-type domain-containing protein n=1 Tax=Cognatishimia activa TaxID=1715691 RepID=A0A0P1IU02_9RHOB|nr:LysR family transcriptional regulator [Cognatishimia activa]CUJ37020.1 hypothetical protein TA5113_03203 [Cognatishimia activa]CUK26981.1 hypothetical protein TA5114_02800 [Cognatishimia activa]